MRVAILMLMFLSGIASAQSPAPDFYPKMTPAEAKARSEAYAKDHPSAPSRSTGLEARTEPGRGIYSLYEWIETHDCDSDWDNSCNGTTEIRTFSGMDVCRVSVKTLEMKRGSWKFRPRPNGGTVTVHSEGNNAFFDRQKGRVTIDVAVVWISSTATPDERVKENCLTKFETISNYDPPEGESGPLSPPCALAGTCSPSPQPKSHAEEGCNGMPKVTYQVCGSCPAGYYPTRSQAKCIQSTYVNGDVCGSMSCETCTCSPNIINP